MTGRNELLLAGALLLAPIILKSEPGRTGGATLLRATEARPLAMGGASSAVAGDIQSIALNPAAAGTLPASAATATFFRGIAEDDLGVVNYAHTFPFGGVRIGGIYYNSGDFEASLLDGTVETRTAQEDSVGVLTAAFGGSSPVALGLTGKFYRFELAEEVHASGAVVDAGVLWKTPLQGLTVGAAVLNSGPDVKFEVESDPLPTTSRAGLSYSLDLSQLKNIRIPYATLIAVDGLFPKEESGYVAAGLELRHFFEIARKASTASLRFGFASDTQSLTGGIGLRVSNLLLDYAIGFKEDFDESHRVTLGYEFAGEPAPVIRKGKQTLENLEDR